MSCRLEMIRPYRIEHDKDKCIMKNVESYGHYVKLILESNENRVEVLVGETTDYRWICVPDYKISSRLATYGDVFWNYENITGIEDECIHLMIVYGIQEYGEMVKEHRL